MSNAIDVRTRVYCNRGPVISGSLEENTIVGAGLVNVTGNVVLDGVYRVKEGDVIELAYYKNGRMARLGRKLRATSVYANPITRTTEIALGCLLTYNKDNEPPPKVISSEDDTETEDLTELERLLMIKPINASYIARMICEELGIDHVPIPLTNQFYKETFEISGPYLNVLSDLLISENYVGYIDSQERLRFINLLEQDGAGPVLNESKIIDIQPINSGDPPADTIYAIVNYTGVKLDDALTGDTGETEEEIQARYGYFGYYVPRVSEWRSSYEAGETVTREFRHQPLNSSGNPDRAQDPIEESITYTSGSSTSTGYILDERESPPQYKIGVVNKYTAGPWGNTYEYTDYSYDKRGGAEYVFKITYRYEPAPVIVEACGFPPEAVPPLPRSIASVLGSGRLLTEVIYEEAVSTEEYSVTRSTRSVSAVKTADGAANIQKRLESYQQQYADPVARGDAIRKAGIATYAAQRVAIGTTVSYNESAPNYNAPTDANTGPDENNPENGYTYEVTQTPEIIYVKDSGGGINLELTPPYMSDDKVEKIGEYYRVTPSDATEKATAFARTQNRLRRGYRNGQSIVYPIEYMPIAPFKPLYLSFGGVVGQFRSDRTNIVFDSTGILVSTDAIFWGGVGR